MNITIMCDVLGEANNGTSLAAYNLINSLKEKGHHVKVVCSDIEKLGVEGYYVLKNLNLGLIINKALDRNGVNLAKKDKRIIQEACENADIVHGMMPFCVSKAGLKYCLKNNIPFTTGFHAQSENFCSHIFSMNSKLINHLYYKFVFKTYYNKCSAIHYPTEFIKNFTNKYDKNKTKSYIISNGVELSMYYPNKIEKDDSLKGKFVIIMSGRLSKEKNQKELIEAIALSKHEKDIQLVLAGSGPFYKRLMKRGEKLTNKIIIKKYKHSEISKAMWMSDLYVHSSLVEIEAISCLEAIACGLVPVISDSKRSATSKFALDKRSIYKKGNPRDLADKIDYWFENKEERERMSSKYSELAKSFEINTQMEKMEQMLLEVIDNYAKK